MAQEILNWEYKFINQEELKMCADNFDDYLEYCNTGTEILAYRRYIILYDYEQIFVEDEQDMSGYWVCDYDGEDEEAFKIGQHKVDQLILNEPSPGQLELNYGNLYVS
jgi:hypothetical protein